MVTCRMYISISSLTFSRSNNHPGPQPGLLNKTQEWTLLPFRRLSPYYTATRTTGLGTMERTRKYSTVKHPSLHKLTRTATGPLAGPTDTTAIYRNTTTSDTTDRLPKTRIALWMYTGVPPTIVRAPKTAAQVWAKATRATDDQVEEEVVNTAAPVAPPSGTALRRRHLVVTIP